MFFPLRNNYNEGQIREYTRKQNDILVKYDLDNLNELITRIKEIIEEYTNYINE